MPLRFLQRALPRLELVAKIRVRGYQQQCISRCFGSHFDTVPMQYLASRMVNMPDITDSPNMPRRYRPFGC